MLAKCQQVEKGHFENRADGRRAETARFAFFRAMTHCISGQLGGPLRTVTPAVLPGGVGGDSRRNQHAEGSRLQPFTPSASSRPAAPRG